MRTFNPAIGACEYDSRYNGDGTGGDGIGMPLNLCGVDGFVYAHHHNVFDYFPNPGAYVLLRSHPTSGYALAIEFRAPTPIHCTEAGENRTNWNELNNFPLALTSAINSNSECGPAVSGTAYLTALP